MKILFISYSYLDGNGGGIYASRAYINAFAELSEEMTLLYPYKKNKDVEGVNEEKIKMIPIEDTRNKFRKLIGLYMGMVNRFVDIDTSFFDSSKYDFVVFNNSTVSHQLIRKFKAAGIKAITIHHNYQIEYLKGDASILTKPAFLFWTKKFEREAVYNSDLNIVLTKQDENLLKKHYKENAIFEILGVFEYTKDQIPNQRNTTKELHNYLITGRLDTKQTENSLIPWIKEYYPLLKKFDSRSTLTIAGRSPSARLTKICKENGIDLIASPPDMNSIMQNADCYICPTSLGGGLKLRIMDGLKYGLPVLTHAVSARGYETIIEKGIVYSYTNKASFIEGLNSINSKKILNEDIQALYQETFSFDAGVMRLKRIMEKVNY